MLKMCMNLVHCHGFPKMTISDKDVVFMRYFWKTLCPIMRILSKLATAFHPLADCQTGVSNS